MCNGSSSNLSITYPFLLNLSGEGVSVVRDTVSDVKGTIKRADAGVSECKNAAKYYLWS